MNKEKTTIIEITGIMGAGFLPGLLQNLKREFEESFLYFDTENSQRNLKAIYHIDNTWAESKDKRKRNRIDYLLRNSDRLTSIEWNELITSLNWIDNLFAKNLAYWKKKYGFVDIAFRRGGLLQTYTLLKGKQWEEATIYRKPQPRLKIFLIACKSIIKNTYTNDINSIKIIKSDQENYLQTPDQAYHHQQEWLEEIEGHPGVHIIERDKFSKEEFSKSLALKIPELLKPYIKIESKVKIFISYSTKDELFARQIYNNLIESGIQCWFAPENLKIGDRFKQEIRKSIHLNNKLLLILSKNSISSDWVEDEVDMALDRERREKMNILFPISIDDAVNNTNQAWAETIRRKRHIGNFTNWSNEKKYKNSLTRLLRDLRNEDI